jgi:hypothetical protein
MIEAYVLIQSQVGTAAHVAGAISAIPGVLRAKAVTGPYDVIVQAWSWQGSSRSKASTAP